MPVSPRTQMMMEEAGGGDPQELFEQSFQELAFNQLSTKAPEIVDSVISFKIHEADPNANHAVGAFILDRNGQEVHVPAIFADNEILPFDTMYVKGLDKILPLTEEWLIEVDNIDESHMGESMKAPDSLASDVDIRNVVVPPTTGRYSYASSDPNTNLPAYLREVSNPVKKAFVSTLEQHPHIAKYAFTVYGVNALQEALTPHAPIPQTKQAAPTVSFMTMETPAEEIKERARENSTNVYKTIAQQGYAAWDERPELEMSVMYETEGPLTLTVPSDTGFYRIFRTDGRTQIALIFGKILSEDRLRFGKELPGHLDYKSNENKTRVCRMGLTEDDELFVTNTPFVAEPVSIENVPDKMKKMIIDPSESKPKNNQKGFYYNPNQSDLVALEPVSVQRVWSTDGSEFAAGQTYNLSMVTLQKIKGSPITQPKLLTGLRTPEGRAPREYVPRSFRDKKRQSHEEARADSAGETVILVPEDWVFFSVKKVISPAELLRSPEDVTMSFFHRAREKGASELQVLHTGAGLYAVDDVQRDKLSTVKHLVHAYQLSVPDAERAVKQAHDKTVGRFFVFDRDKIAQPVPAGPPPAGPPPAGPPPAGPPPAGPPPAGAAPADPAMMDPAMMDPAMMDPAMMDPAMMDPAMMAPPPPPPPNAVEIAAQEVADTLAEQHQQLMSQMAQQQQSVQTQMAAIHAVVNRANELSSMAGLAPPEVVPPMVMPPDPSLMAEAGLPPEGQDPAMVDPIGMQMAMERGGMPPGGAPGEMPPEGMPVEEPGMMETAMELEDPDLFDSAAIASLAKNNNFDNTVSGFLPALRDSLDALGRMLTEVRMKAPVLRERVGDGTYNEIRDKLETLFEGMGETILKTNAIIADDEEVDAPV